MLTEPVPQATSRGQIRPDEMAKTLPVSSLMSLEGKVAIVTGAAAGIGEAIAARFAEAGAHVVVADVDSNGAQRTVEAVTRAGGSAKAYRVDVHDLEDVRSLVVRTGRELGHLDILVNNAGIFPFSPALEVTPETWDRVQAINLRGSFFLAQAAAQAMVRGGRGGSIINIASVDALHPTGNLVHYDASKGGLVAMTRSLALEVARHGIRVNAIAPGSIDTPGARSATMAVTKGTGVDLAELAKMFLARIPMGRMGAPDEIARVALFLASRASEYVTGSLVVVDGGYLLS